MDYPLQRKRAFCARTLAKPPVSGNFGGKPAAVGQRDIHKRCG
jgi:hypothetical protein